MIRVMQQLRKKNVALFGTLSAYPHSEHAKKVLAKAHNYLTGNTILGSFLCLGKLTKERYLQKLTNPSINHPMTQERKKRLLEGQKHPNQEDVKNFQNFFDTIIEKQDKNSKKD